MTYKCNYCGKFLREIYVYPIDLLNINNKYIKLWWSMKDIKDFNLVKNLLFEQCSGYKVEGKNLGSFCKECIHYKLFEYEMIYGV